MNKHESSNLRKQQQMKFNVKSLLSFIFKDKRFFNAKNKNHQIGKLNLKLLDCPWTHGAQYLLPRVYLVGEVRFDIEYKNVACNTKF